MTTTIPGGKLERGAILILYDNSRLSQSKMNKGAKKKGRQIGKGGGQKILSTKGCEPRAGGKNRRRTWGRNGMFKVSKQV